MAKVLYDAEKAQQYLELMKMIEYRIVEKQYSDGGISFAVEKKFGNEEWTSIIHTKDLEKAREVLQERRNNAIVKQRVIE